MKDKNYKTLMWLSKEEFAILQNPQVIEIIEKTCKLKFLPTQETNETNERINHLSHGAPSG